MSSISSRGGRALLSKVCFRKVHFTRLTNVYISCVKSLLGSAGGGGATVGGQLDEEEDELPRTS